MAEQKQVGDSSVKDFSGMIGISSKFAVLNRLITRDLNNNTTTPTFSLYSIAGQTSANADLSRPQSGQTQSSGISSNGVPGAMPFSGSPTAGS